MTQGCIYYILEEDNDILMIERWQLLGNRKEQARIGHESWKLANALDLAFGNWELAYHDNGLKLAIRNWKLGDPASGWEFATVG